MRARWLGLMVVAIAAVTMATACASNERFASTVVSAPAPNFTLRTAGERTISLADLKGEVVVVYFGYTHCPDVCPTTMSTYAQAVARLPEGLRGNLRVVMVSVDPKRDTPEIMAKYVAHFSPGFIGLSGSQAEIDAVIADWNLSVECFEPSADGAYSVGHPASSYVLDKSGRKRLIVPFTCPWKHSRQTWNCCSRRDNPVTIWTIQRRGLAVLLVAGSALAATACGGDEPVTTPTATTPPATATATVTPTPTPAVPKISVTGAWARSTPGNPNENSAVYAVIANEGSVADHVVSASVDASIAKTVETHRTVKVGDTMKMEPVAGWDVPANGKLTLEPGGNHIMLLSLPTALKAGSRFPLTLKFEKAGNVVVDVDVRAATGEAMAPGGMGAAGGMGAPSATPAMGR